MDLTHKFAAYPQERELLRQLVANEFQVRQRHRSEIYSQTPQASVASAIREDDKENVAAGDQHIKEALLSPVFSKPSKTPAVVEFNASSVAALDRTGSVDVIVIRKGNKKIDCKVQVHSVDGGCICISTAERLTMFPSVGTGGA